MEITHKTATAINRLRHIVSAKRFLELTGNVPVEELTQETAAPVEKHLIKLQEWYSQVANVTLEFIEESNARRLHNPEAFAIGLTPKLIDLLSVHIWKQDKKNDAS